MDSEEMGSFRKGLVSLIIPTMTRRKTESIKTILRKRYLLEDCIRDCRQNIRCPLEILVVCNSFDDPHLVGYISQNKDIDRFVLNSTNVGVPRSWNMGASMAMGEYLCFVNDDVEIGPGAIETMKEVMESDLYIGQVGPAGGLWYRKEPGKRVGTAMIEEADEISGWLFMVRRKVFDMVGGVDNAYTPALCEEIDLSFAIRKAGYRCLVIPGLNAKHHHISGASSTNRPLRVFDMEWKREDLTERNRCYFERKWVEFWDEKHDD